MNLKKAQQTTEQQIHFHMKTNLLGSKIVNHSIAFTAIKKEEVTMWRVSLGNSLRKDKDPV